MFIHGLIVPEFDFHCIIFLCGVALKETVPQFSCNDIPIVRMNSEGISFNNACVNLLPQANFAQILVNFEKKLLLVRTSATKDKYAFCWVPTDDQIIVLDTSLFFGKLCEYMDWRIDYVYSMCGNILMLDGKKAISFDMTNAVCEEYEQPKKHRTPPKNAEYPLNKRHHPIEPTVQ